LDILEVGATRPRFQLVPASPAPVLLANTWLVAQHNQLQQVFAQTARHAPLANISLDALAFRQARAFHVLLALTFLGVILAAVLPAQMRNRQMVINFYWLVIYKIFHTVNFVRQ
jgi:hypothetical protein